MKSDLHTWDTLLAESAIAIIMERARFFSWLDKQSVSYLALPGKVTISLKERHSLEENTKNAFLSLLDTYRERDLIVGRTTI